MSEGRAAFARGEFYEAHELWEEVWNHADDPDRRWIQGLIQLATAWHKLAGGNGEVGGRLFRKGLAKLEEAPDRLDGVDVAAARRDAEAALAELARGDWPVTRRGAI